MFRLDFDDLDPRPMRDLDRRRALAFAEAILPGNETIRPADERTVALVLQCAEHISPWATRALGGAMALLDRAAVVSSGRTFAALDRHAQQALLVQWEQSAVLRAPLSLISFALKFTHFDTPEVYEELGGRLNVVQHMEQPRWLEQVVQATEWDADETIECEVVVVGTGAGGAVVGKELAERGYAVAFVEEGKHHRRDAFTGSSLQAHFDLYRGGFTVGNSLMPVFMGRLVGGSTAVNTGSCFRTPDFVLDRWCEDIGTDEFRSSEMARHFERVEQILEVELADAAAVGPIGDVMARGCDALGWAHSRMLRNAPGCKGEGFCDFGCRTDARKSTNLSYVPKALERGSMLFTGLRADRVWIENGRAVGVEGVDAGGRRLKVRADRVVFSGGAIPTPTFLLQQGLANSSGQVGRNLTLHPSTGFSARMNEQLEPHRHIPQGYFVSEWIREGILINAAQPDRNFAPLVFPHTGERLMEAMSHLDEMAHFGVMIADEKASGVVHIGPDGLPVVRYDLTKGDVARMHRGFIAAGDMAWAAGAQSLHPVVMRMPEVKSQADWQRFKSLDLGASDLMLMSYHPLGSCKMGLDPKTSVVGLDHQCHDVPGLYLVDGSTVPGPLGVNPQITIMAMATRAAEHIADAM